mgnify:CR=1 FL=1
MATRKPFKTDVVGNARFELKRAQIMAESGKRKDIEALRRAERDLLVATNAQKKRKPKML